MEPILIRDMIMDAVQIPDTVWEYYVYLKEKRSFKINPSKIASMIKQSASCGRRQAQILREVYNRISMGELAEKLHVEVLRTSQIELEDKIVFALFEEPNIVKIASGLLEDAANLIVSEQLMDVIDPNAIEDILLAHELYHVVECVNANNIYTRNCCYLNIGRWPLKKKVRLGFASEIGAMAFAKEWLGLSYHPCALDLLLTQVVDSALASSIYKKVKNLQELDIY